MTSEAAQIRGVTDGGWGKSYSKGRSERGRGCLRFFSSFHLCVVIPANGDYRAEQLFLLHRGDILRTYMHYIIYARTHPAPQMMFYWRFCLKTNSPLVFVLCCSTPPPTTHRHHRRTRSGFLYVYFYFVLFQSPNRLLVEYHTICSCAWKTSTPPPPPPQPPSPGRMLIRWEKLHWAAQPTDLIRDDYTCGRTLLLRNCRPASHKLLIAPPPPLPFRPNMHGRNFKGYCLMMVLWYGRERWSSPGTRSCGD